MSRTWEDWLLEFLEGGNIVPFLFNVGFQLLNSPESLLGFSLSDEMNFLPWWEVWTAGKPVLYPDSSNRKHAVLMDSVLFRKALLGEGLKIMDIQYWLSILSFALRNFLEIFGWYKLYLMLYSRFSQIFVEEQWSKITFHIMLNLSPCLPLRDWISVKVFLHFRIP